MADLKLGSQGADVQNLQMELYAASYYHSRPDFNPGAQDGVFGTNTLAAIRNFQAAVGLPADGIAGSDTISALNAVNASQPGSIGFYTSGATAVGGGVTSKLFPSLGTSLPSPAGIVSPATKKVVTAAQPVDWKIIGIAGAVVLGIIFFAGDDSKKRR